MTFPTAEFWASFCRQHWECEPLVLRRPFEGLFAEPQDAFATLVRASDAFRAGENVRLRLFGQHGLVMADLDRLLPEASDGSFAGYAARVTCDLGSETFTLVANYFHTHDPGLWSRTRRFLAGLYAHVGLPADHADLDVFVSNKRLTPFGIHRDPASNFTLVLLGRKRMRLWPAGFFGRRPPTDPASYSRYLEHARTLEGEPGDLLYWPSHNWHVAESDGELSVTMNVSLYLDATAEAPGYPPVEVVGQRARHLALRRLRSPRSPSTYPVHSEGLQASAAELPESVSAALATFQEMGRDGSLAREVAALWLNRLTSSGFNRLPPPGPATAPEDGDEVRVDPDFPVLWREVGAEIAVSANGRTIFLPRRGPDVVRLLGRLNAGERHSVADLLEEFSPAAEYAEAEGPSPRERLRRLLGLLAGWGSLETTRTAPERKAPEPDRPSVGVA